MPHVNAALALGTAQCFHLCADLGGSSTSPILVTRTNTQRGALPSHLHWTLFLLEALVQACSGLSTGPFHKHPAGRCVSPNHRHRSHQHPTPARTPALSTSPCAGTDIPHLLNTRRETASLTGCIFSSQNSSCVSFIFKTKQKTTKTPNHIRHCSPPAGFFYSFKFLFQLIFVSLIFLALSPFNLY